jgi:uncharacterized membrane protein required for colicin V production
VLLKGGLFVALGCIISPKHKKDEVDMVAADYIAIGIIVVFALIGLKAGLIKSVYRVAAFAASVFLSIKLSKPVAGWFENTSIYDGIREPIENLVGKLNINFAEISNPSNAKSIEEAMTKLPFPDNVKTDIADSLAESGMKASALMDGFVDKIAFFILVIICAIVLFILLRILFWLFGMLIKGIAEIPVIKQVDRVSGFILGAAVGLGLVYGICLLLTYTASFEKWNFIYENINNGVIAPFFYNNNILIEFFNLGKGGV